MPVSSFLVLISGVIAAAALTIWLFSAVSLLGLAALPPAALFAALLARRWL